MRRTIPLLSLLFLASCVSEFRKGREDFYGGVHELQRNHPEGAQSLFKESDEHFQASIAEEGLSPHRMVTAISYRVHSLIELDHHAEALALSSTAIQSYSLELAYDGDPLGLALIRSHALDPERSFAELLLADQRFAGTVKARLHVAWEQVHALEKLGTPKAKAQAVRMCDQHAGKLDFDEMKKRLSSS